MSEYIRCPRCELNLIKKKDKLYSVFKAELDAEPNLDDMDLEICPICKTNYIRPDEIMCKQCIKERSLEDVIVSHDDDDWDSYLNPDEDNISSDEETGDMASITDLDSTDLDDDLEIDDSDLPDIGEDSDFGDDEDNEDEEFEDDLDEDDDFDDDDDDFDDDDDEDDE